MKTEKEYLPIEDYGVIGNLHTTALVSKQGSIDFLTFDRYDSPTVFGALLDRKKGGYFSIDVKDQSINYKQLYLPDTAVLITRYLTQDGIVELTDFMPPLEVENRFVLVRKLKVIKGQHSIKITLMPAFNYGQDKFKAKKEGQNLIVESTGSDQKSFYLLSDIKFKEEKDQLISEINVKSKDEICMVMVSHDKELPPPKSLKHYTEKSFNKTIKYWRNWVKINTYSGRWQDVVNRSAITLKLLSSYKYGSTVAAATFSLPELLGGDRNWDYRFSWIRDSAFTMYTFLQLGYTEEAKRFIQWIKNRSLEIEDAADLKLMYRVDGSTNLKETNLDNFEGYKGSKPVRIGNGAFNQFQLDIYGELIDTIYIYNKNAEPISYEFWLNLIKFIDFVCENWKEKDRGIWEVRDEKKEFLISKVMSWVALDRGILIAENRSFPAPIDRWRKTRDEIFQDVFNNYWNEDKKAFVQYRGGSTLDAAALLMPLVRMLSPKEPKWISTLRAIENELVTDTLVYRYRLDEGAQDGFADDESTFSMCSFWYIECLAKAGEIDRAILFFEKILGYANHLGLFSEQISLKGELLGNYPQAFTHLALISSARQLKILIDLNKE